MRVHSPTSRSGSRIYLSIWDLFWALEPIQEVVESDESVVILWLALDSREGDSARCGSLNIALLRTAAVFVIRVI